MKSCRLAVCARCPRAGAAPNLNSARNDSFAYGNQLSVRPRASVIIPCRNEEPYIEACLRSISVDSGIVDLEILVVDGRSTDETRSVIQRVAGDLGNVRLIDNPSGRIPAALNIGLAAAREEFIVRADAHAVYEPGYIPESLRLMDELGADCVGWFVRTQPAGGSYLARIITDVWTSPFGLGNEPSKTTVPGASPREVSTVFGGCYRRAVFEKVGTYNERLFGSEDVELNTRLRRSGGRILLIPRFGCTYILKATTVVGFLGKTLSNGFWSTYPIWVVGGYPLALRHVVPLAFVVALLAGIAVGLVDRRVLAFDITVLLAYAIVGLAFLSRIPPRRPDRALARLLLAFVFHVAYGLGSLRGLLQGAFEAARAPRWPIDRERPSP